MRTEMIETLPLIIIAALAVIIWLFAAYSFLNMLRHVRDGRWLRLLFQYGWWNPDKVEEYINRPGIEHYHRLMKAIVYFLAVVGCGIVYVIVQLTLQG